MANLTKFWGVEVSGKEPCQVSIEQGFLIHVSTVTLDDIKNVDEHVLIYVKVGDVKYVACILTKDNPQMSLDLAFDDDFEISHNWENGNIHVLGYQAAFGGSESDIDFSDDEEEDLPIAKENGLLGAPAAKAPAVNPKANNKAELEEKADSDEEDSSGEDDSDDDDEGMSDSDNDEDILGDSEEETPAKVADAGKKRPNADVKTPQSKKAKLATPQETDDKKGPQPTKGGSAEKTPKSARAEVPCGSCKKTFKSEVGMLAHTKAKHGGQ